MHLILQWLLTVNASLDVYFLINLIHSFLRCDVGLKSFPITYGYWTFNGVPIHQLCMFKKYILTLLQDSFEHISLFLCKEVGN